MRTLFLLAAVANTSLAQQAQVTTTLPSRTRQDSLHVMVERKLLSPAQVRVLGAQLQARVDQLKKQEFEHRAEREAALTAGRMDELARMDTELRRMYFDNAQMQSQLAMSCAELRPRAGQPDAYIGIAFRDSATARIRAGVEAEIERFIRVPVIGDVSVGSPAEKAGVRPGDWWMALNGRELVGMQVDSVFALLKPGARVELRMRRGDRDVDLPTIVEKKYPGDVCDRFMDVNVFEFRLEGPDGKVFSIVRPPTPMPRVAPTMPRMSGGDPGGQFMIAGFASVKGARFSALTNERREVLKVQPDEGVLVDAVEKDSPAQLAGLRDWDVVVRVNGDRVASVQDLFGAFKMGSNLVLSVVRGGETRTVTIPR